MFLVRNVPVVVEPGVGIIEAEFAVSDGAKKPRTFPVRLFRVELNQESAAQLPFIPSTRTAHVFSLTQQPEESCTLIVYDHLGRISYVYTRDKTGKAWEKKEVAAEHAGKTVTQFSVRFSFHSSKARDKFMEAVDSVLSQMQNDQQPNAQDVNLVFSMLARSRVAPVVMPVAVAKDDLKQVKI